MFRYNSGRPSKNEPTFLVDGAPWYNEILSRRGLKYVIRARGRRNAIESRFSQIKEKNFYKRFLNSSFKTIESWILSFIAPYILKRCHDDVF